MTADASDTFCMISTGVATATRKHYSNGEEYVYEVERPIVFNGIAGNLIERSDLASRTIKLLIPRITARRSMADLNEEFERVWPGVLGACLTALLVHCKEPARL